LRVLRRPLNALRIIAIEEELGSRRYARANAFELSVAWLGAGDKGTDSSTSGLIALASMALPTSAPALRTIALSSTFVKWLLLDSDSIVVLVGEHAFENVTTESTGKPVRVPPCERRKPRSTFHDRIAKS
jgi:hypothetical protein